MMLINATGAAKMEMSEDAKAMLEEEAFRFLTAGIPLQEWVSLSDSEKDALYRAGERLRTIYATMTGLSANPEMAAEFLSQVGEHEMKTGILLTKAHEALEAAATAAGEIK